MSDLHKAMAFFHSDGLVAAWNQASRFAGEEGHIATLPEIITARMQSEVKAVPWMKYFTTRSAEYFGLSVQGNPIIIVAHGVGPMANLEGIKSVYRYHYNDKTGSRRGGRIPKNTFRALENGVFGDVYIIDYKEYTSLFAYPFIEPTNLLKAKYDKLTYARLGGEHVAAPYLDLQAQIAVNEFKQRFPTTPNRCRYKTNPYVVENRDETNVAYQIYDYFHPEGDMALAHLLSIGQLGWIHYAEEEFPCLNMEISCHSWYDGVRFLGVRGDGLSNVSDGPNAYELLREHWHELMTPAEFAVQPKLVSLTQIGETWFSQYPKQGEGMDTWEPEYQALAVKEVGEPVVFRTPVLGYYGFFKYDPRRVKRLAPRGANAYYIFGEPENVWEGGNPVQQKANVQFYNVVLDTSQRLLRVDDLGRDFEKMMSLMGVE